MDEQRQKVVLFSGGRTSGYMLKRLLDEAGPNRDFIVIFCNTGKERNETLDFVHECEVRWGVEIIWLEYHRVLASEIPAGVFPTERRNSNLAKQAASGETTHWFKRVNYETASRNGEPFDEMLEWATALPNVVSRICSVQLKMRTASRFIFASGIGEYSPLIGIRKDEEHRATQILASCEVFEHPMFPLLSWHISEKQVMSFWRKSEFDLNLQSYEGNCDLCFLKAKWKRIKLVQDHPEMIEWWKGWEAKKEATKNGKLFRLDESYADLEQIAKHAKDQSEFCFVGQSEDIPCSCAEKGFGSAEDE